MQRLNYMELAPEGMAAMSSVEHFLNTATGLQPSLLELVRLFVSLLNGCEFCIGLHTHELTKRHETPDRTQQVLAWRESTAYTERERAAFAWAEAVTNVQMNHVPDEAFVDAREHFAEPDLVHLTIAIASINAWNRMGIAFRPEHRSPLPHRAEAADSEPDDGGKVSVEDME